MSKPEEPEKAIWGTWEELLLACAVNRHGTKSWDSVAMEIQNRSSYPHLLTAQNCKQTYYELQKRFLSKNENRDEGEDETNNDDNNDNNNHSNRNSSNKKKIPWWLEELRKLRVDELRREVQRYDVSIVSLQLKVKKLKEEREQSMNEMENDEEKSDLKKDSKTEYDRVKEAGENKEDEEDKSSPENHAGDESDRGNQSFNSSNSTNPEGEDRKPEAEEEDEKPKKEEIAILKLDPVPGEPPEEKAVGEGSYNGSSDTITKATDVSPLYKFSGVIPETGESPEFPESFAESKGGEEGVKESSDVQSSASLSTKSRREKAIAGSSGDSPVADVVSPVNNRIAGKSLPLVDFLEIIRSHKYGSVFQRRLVSQETSDYQILIRQHVDLETVRRKLDGGQYSSNRLEFFRDLLLLFNNAIVFFPKDSNESVGARNLRKIVTREMASQIWKAADHHHSKEPTPPPPLLPNLGKDPVAKRTVSGPVIVCRKRSSISAKAASLAVAEVKREERLTTVNEKPDNSPANATTEPNIAMKSMRDRSASKLRSLRTSKNRNGNGQGNTNSNRNQTSTSSSIPETAEGKMEKKNASAVAKKRSVANFLNRMKRSSSSANGTLLDTLKNCVNSSDNSKGGDQKKGGKGDGRKDKIFRQGSAAKSVQKQSSPAKRSVGRPPKRAAPPPPPPPPPAKRAKDTGEKPALGTRAARKRARR